MLGLDIMFHNNLYRLIDPAMYHELWIVRNQESNRKGLFGSQFTAFSIAYCVDSHHINYYNDLLCSITCCVKVKQPCVQIDGAHCGTLEYHSERGNAPCKMLSDLTSQTFLYLNPRYGSEA